MILEMEKEALRSALFASDKETKKMLSLLQTISGKNKFSALKMDEEKKKYQSLLNENEKLAKLLRDTEGECQFLKIEMELLKMDSDSSSGLKPPRNRADVMQNDAIESPAMEIDSLTPSQIIPWEKSSQSNPQLTELSSSSEQAIAMQNDAIESPTMEIDSSTPSQIIQCEKSSQSNSQLTVQNSTQNPEHSTKIDIKHEHNYAALGPKARRFTCERCGYVAKRKYTLENHMKNHCTTKVQKDSMCLICLKKFTHNGLRSHLMGYIKAQKNSENHEEFTAKIHYNNTQTTLTQLN